MDKTLVIETAEQIAVRCREGATPENVQKAIERVLTAARYENVSLTKRGLRQWAKSRFNVNLSFYA